MSILLQVQVSQAEDDQWALMYMVTTLKKSMLSYWSKIYFLFMQMESNIKIYGKQNIGAITRGHFHFTGGQHVDSYFPSILPLEVTFLHQQHQGGSCNMVKDQSRFLCLEVK